MWAHATPCRSLTIQVDFFFFLRFKDTFFHQNHNTVKWKAKGFPVRIKLITFSYQRRIQSQILRQGWPLQEAAADTVLEAAPQALRRQREGVSGRSCSRGAGESPPLVLAARGQGTECGGLGLLTRGWGLRVQYDTHQAGGKGPGLPRAGSGRGWCGIPQGVTACEGRTAGPQDGAQEEGGGGWDQDRETGSGTSPPLELWRRASPSLSVCWADCKERPGESRSGTARLVQAAASPPCSHSRRQTSLYLDPYDLFPPARCYPPRPRSLSCCCRKPRNSSKDPSLPLPWLLHRFAQAAAGNRKSLQGPPRSWPRPKARWRAGGLRPLAVASRFCARLRGLRLKAGRARP